VGGEQQGRHRDRRREELFAVDGNSRVFHLRLLFILDLPWIVLFFPASRSLRLSLFALNVCSPKREGGRTTASCWHGRRFPRYWEVRSGQCIMRAFGKRSEPAQTNVQG
jgi:hypothetical protein